MELNNLALLPARTSPDRAPSKIKISDEREHGPMMLSDLSPLKVRSPSIVLK